MDNLATLFAKNVDYYRRAKLLSWYELAAACDVSLEAFFPLRRRLVMGDTGDTKLELGLLAKMVKVLGVEPSRLFIENIEMRYDAVEVTCIDASSKGEKSAELPVYLVQRLLDERKQLLEIAGQVSTLQKDVLSSIQLELDIYTTGFGPIAYETDDDSPIIGAW